MTEYYTCLARGCDGSSRIAPYYLCSIHLKLTPKDILKQFDDLRSSPNSHHGHVAARDLIVNYWWNNKQRGL